MSCKGMSEAALQILIIIITGWQATEQGRSSIAFIWQLPRDVLLPPAMGEGVLTCSIALQTKNHLDLNPVSQIGYRYSRGDNFSQNKFHFQN